MNGNSHEALASEGWARFSCFGVSDTDQGSGTSTAEHTNRAFEGVFAGGNVPSVKTTFLSIAPKTGKHVKAEMWLWVKPMVPFRGRCTSHFCLF